MSENPDKEEIRQKYNKFAPWYDIVEGVPEFLGVRNLRRDLIKRASGRVLEVAVGTGKNLPYYPRTCEITAIDLSPAMIEIARRRADRLGLNATFLVMDGEDLSFHCGSFDTVIETLTLCTYLDPVAALRETSRVCRVDGRILLLEHGRSDRGWLGRLQDRWAGQFAKPVGCHWNREPLDLVRQAGLKVVNSRHFFGIFHTIKSTPENTRTTVTRRK